MYPLIIWRGLQATKNCARPRCWGWIDGWYTIYIRWTLKETRYKVRNTTKVLNEVIFAAGLYHMPSGCHTHPSLISSYWSTGNILKVPGTISIFEQINVKWCYNSIQQKKDFVSNNLFLTWKVHSLMACQHFESTVLEKHSFSSRFSIKHTVCHCMLQTIC